jgi:hypothetical protein
MLLSLVRLNYKNAHDLISVYDMSTTCNDFDSILKDCLEDANNLSSLWLVIIKVLWVSVTKLIVWSFLHKTNEMKHAELNDKNLDSLKYFIKQIVVNA